MAIKNKNSSRGPARPVPQRTNLTKNNAKSSPRNVVKNNKDVKSGSSNRYKEVKEKKNSRKNSIPDFPWKGVGSALGWLLTISLGLFIFIGIGFGLVQGYKYFTSSPYFALKTIEVRGAYRLKSREILDTLKLDVGVNTLAVSIDEMERALASNPWVSELSVKRNLPDSFTIVIKERDPRFWVKIDGATWYADIYGKPIAVVSSEKFTSLPLLEVEAGAEINVGRLPDIVRSLHEAELPLEMVKISWLKLSAGNVVDMRLEGNNMAISLGVDDWSGNLQRLSIVLQDLAKKGELRRTKSVNAHGRNVWVEETQTTG